MTIDPNTLNHAMRSGYALAITDAIDLLIARAKVPLDAQTEAMLQSLSDDLIKLSENMPDNMLARAKALAP